MRLCLITMQRQQGVGSALWGQDTGKQDRASAGLGVGNCVTTLEGHRHLRGTPGKPMSVTETAVAQGGAVWAVPQNWHWSLYPKGYWMHSLEFPATISCRSQATTTARCRLRGRMHLPGGPGLTSAPLQPPHPCSGDPRGSCLSAKEAVEWPRSQADPSQASGYQQHWWARLGPEGSGGHLKTQDCTRILAARPKTCPGSLPMSPKTLRPLRQPQDP